MRIKIGFNGAIETYNEAGHLHSFNNKPAYISPNGAVYWYDNGRITKAISHKGKVTCYQ